MSNYTIKEHQKYLDKQIAYAETSGNKMIVSVITGFNETYQSYSCCKTCYEKLNGIEMDIEEYKINPILPHNECTRKKDNPHSKNKFCICDLGFRSKRDENGNIIRK